jgi:hypothetical protein
VAASSTTDRRGSSDALALDAAELLEEILDLVETVPGVKEVIPELDLRPIPPYPTVSSRPPRGDDHSGQECRVVTALPYGQTMSIGRPDTHPVTSGQTTGADSRPRVNTVRQERPVIHRSHDLWGGHHHSSAPSPVANCWRPHHVGAAECAWGGDGQRFCCRIGRN